MAEETNTLLPRWSHEQSHSSLLSFTSSSAARSRGQLRRFLTSKAGHYSVLLLVSLDVSCIFADFVISLFACEGRLRRSDASVALEILGIVSLVFSSLFMVELCASIWAFGAKYYYLYFKSKFHCFDAVVIIAGFIVDILLRGIIEEVASLVIILRLWRVVKIMEELSVGAQEQMEDLQERLSELERQNEALTTQVWQFQAGSHMSVQDATHLSGLP